MKSRKIIIYLTLILFLIAILDTGCSKISSYQKSIYNDTTKISVIGDSYSFASRSENFINNNFTISFKGFSGKQTIWKLQAKENSDFLIDCNTEINSGKLKICLINEEKEISSIAEGSKTEKITIDINKGISFITIVGIEANGKIELALLGNDKVSVKQLKN